ncbi:MAG: tRNA pseudouridine(55) synthase TruB [Gammaproteobacteria bacterium]|nr:tRNA pseudouridine(55) synthase TruB [Gammaproteobacteria bacterium]
MTTTISPPQNRVSDSAPYGLYLLDKPEGISSNRALQQVKRLVAAKKAGHTGTLDPLASGVLPICLGEATKFAQFLLEADKQYRVTARLGQRTTTCDSEGEIVAEQALSPIDEQRLAVLLQQFRGEISQVPSMFSALKHNGQPLYKLARQGIEVERPARSVQIHQLEQIAWQEPFLSLQVHCSKGTYIRNLVDDIGQALGCGAHVVQLRRSAVGRFSEAQSQPLADLLNRGINSQALISIHAMLLHYPVITLTSQQVKQLYMGQQVVVDSDCIGLVRLQTMAQVFIGMAEINSTQELKVRRLLSTEVVNL